MFELGYFIPELPDKSRWISCTPPLLFHPLISYLCSRQIPGFCVGGSHIIGIENKVNCDIIVGYKSVYRMCFAMACFFFLFSIIMIRVRSSKDPRAAIQNGLVLQLCFLCSTLPQHAALWWPNVDTAPFKNAFTQTLINRFAVCT